MLAIKKLLVCFMLMAFPLYGNNGVNDDSASVTKPGISYPLFELSGGLGLAWLFQFNATISPANHVYLQPRFSYSIIAYDAGFVVGFQNKIEENTILRLGIGYSKGEVALLDPGGGEDDRWQSIYFRLGVLTKWQKNSVVNPNINITRLGRKAILSANVTLGYCIYRK